ncbi:hypothetical protein EIP91_009329 [Steccherinum ochraceum]|uniref:GED domain-containing protein n=1 Tax=Steccherinum ochraceum TaxID=92696 RepID=A0A4R0RTL1_9APHY|nr:hypothetical protein EIP91_009329 [Steccherinum ochraceum]
MTTLLESDSAVQLKHYLGLVKKLRALGAQAELDLPRICVIGGQSSGKSSVVEAISGIHVPRDAGTCTRCPIECRLTNSSDPWVARVSIRTEYDSQGTRLNDIHEVSFGDDIVNAQDVELRLRQAQALVLSASRHPDKLEFLSKSADDLRNLTHATHQFSRNVVCIDISGPELANLDFVDLPGLIQNASTEIVSYIENMVSSHIQGNSLILIAIPMSDDIENQKAVQLAKLVDSDGTRTIGVLTKPDTITTGAVQAKRLWLDVIEGRRHPTKHGYFCTRQPDEDERVSGMSFQEAREVERNFFRSTGTWADSSQPGRFGTAKLIANLSRLLGDVIHKTIPSLDGEVSRQLETCRSQLSHLPPPISSDPPNYILNLITQLAYDCRMLVEGTSDPSLVQTTRKTFEWYQRVVRGTAPVFIPLPSAKDTGDKISSLDLELEDDPWDQEDTSSPRIYLQDVRQRIESSLTRELPHNVPYSAKVSYMQEFRSTWATRATDTFTHVGKAFDISLTTLIERHFGRFSNLRHAIMAHCHELLHTKADETTALLGALLKFEQLPFTVHGRELTVLKDKYLAKYKSFRSPSGRPVSASSTASVSDTPQPIGDVDHGLKPIPFVPSFTPISTSLGNTETVPGTTAPLNSDFVPTPPFVLGSSSVYASPLSEAQSQRPVSGKRKHNKGVLINDTASKQTLGSASPSTTPSLTPLVSSSTATYSASSSPATIPFGTAKSGAALDGHSGSAIASPWKATFSTVQPASKGSSSKPAWTSATQWTSESGESQISSEGAFGAFGSSNQAMPPKNGFLDLNGPGFNVTPPRVQTPQASEVFFPPNPSPFVSISKASSTPTPSLPERSRADDERELLAVLAKLGLSNVTLDDLGKLNAPDMYEEEMELMADVRAYFSVAYRRVTDYVPMAIDHSFLYAFAASLQTTLISKLGLGTKNGDVRCAAYLAEDESIVATRAELEGRKKRLEGVREELFVFHERS